MRRFIYTSERELSLKFIVSIRVRPTLVVLFFVARFTFFFVLSYDWEREKFRRVQGIFLVDLLETAVHFLDNSFSFFNQVVFFFLSIFFKFFSMLIEAKAFAQTEKYLLD